MKTLFVLLSSCLILSEVVSAQYSRFFPYWVKKELNLPTDVASSPDNEVGHSKTTLGYGQSIEDSASEEENTASALFSLLSNNNNNNRQR